MFAEGLLRAIVIGSAIALWLYVLAVLIIHFA